MGFSKVIEEVNFELSKLVLFNNFLNSILVFMVCYLILGLFGFFPLFFSTIFALGYFMFMLFFKARENSVMKVESKYSSLKEKLRTAADNVHMDNSVVQELQEDLLKDLARVEDSTFFSEKETYTKILVIMLIAFLIVFSAPVSLNIINPDIQISDIPRLITGGGKGPSEGKGTGAGLGLGSGNIYGTKSIAKLGSQEINVEIKQIGYEVNLRSVQDIEERQFEDSFPSDVFAQSGETFDENIPKDDQEIVKNYFKAVAENG